MIDLCAERMLRGFLWYFSGIDCFTLVFISASVSIFFFCLCGIMNNIRASVEFY